MQAAESIEWDPLQRGEGRASEASFLLDVIRLTSSAMDPGDCFDRVVREVRTRARGICHASLWGWDADRGLLTALASSGEGDGAPANPGAWRPADGAAQALATRRPFIAAELTTTSGEHVMPAAGARSALFVPVRSGDHVLGLLSLQSRQTGRFGPTEAVHYQILCEHLAGMMHRFGLLDEIRRRTEHVRTIAEIGRRVLAAGDLDECLGAALRDLVDSCGYEEARVLLPEGSRLRVAARCSKSESIAPREELEGIGDGIAGRAAADRRTVCANDLAPEPEGAGSADGARAELCVAMVAGKELMGVLDIRAREPHAFSREHIGLMESLGALLALAIDRARRVEGARLAFERMQADAEAVGREKDALKGQLLHCERLSALGQLISGVAHELNNPLTGVIGYSQLLAESDCEERIRKGIEKVYAEARRCHRVVQGLLDFARRHAPERQYVSINDIVNRTLDLRAYQLRVDDISVVRDLSKDLPRTLADYHQLQQVFLNIVTNAHHAIRETGKGGTLTVRSTADHDRIRVEFSDTGAGIPAGDLDRIFEPFYTTKLPGQGTGLGLAICSGIVKDHQGRILADSSPGEGTIITVDLPVLRREEPPANPE